MTLTKVQLGADQPPLLGLTSGRIVSATETCMLEFCVDAVIVPDQTSR